MKSLLLSFVALFFATTALRAYDFKSGDLYYNITNATDLTVEVTYEVWDYYGNMDNYAGLTTATIPATVSYNGNTYRVTAIGNGAFYSCSTLTSVTIPNSVTSIGYEAFSLCTSLFSIDIPNSVTSIGSGAFRYIPNVVYSGEATGSPWGASGVNGYIEGDLVYKDNTKTWLRACNRAATGDITIPNSVTGIQYSAFARCSGITSVTIPNSVTAIESQAFQACTGLTSIVVESGNTVYDSRENCNAIINTATNSLLHGCKTTIIPNSVTSIGSYAFAEHSTLTDITIPNSVTRIGDGAFSGCSGLSSITIPNSVTSISNSAFSRCSGLTAITIPSSVTSIGMWVFGGCKGLTSMVVESGNTVYDSRENCNAIINTATNSLLYGCKTTVIPNSVTSIANEAFNGHSTLTDISIPNSITSIGEYAFANCTGLTSVTIPNSVTRIGWDAFDGCTGLISVTLPNSITNIEAYTFRGCTGLLSVTIPNSVTTIEYDAFDGCTSLASVTIGNSVTSIGEYAFYDCSSLTSLYMLPSTPPTLGTSVFYNVPTDISVYVPCGTLTAYQAAETWSNFTNYKEWTGYMLSVSSQDDAMGSVRISQEATCTNNTATFEAIPNTNYRFKQWNDGNTDNPRTITLDDNMSFVAQFESAPTALDQTRIDNNATAQKIMRNGQVYILRGGKTYTTMGMEVK